MKSRARSILGMGSLCLTLTGCSPDLLFTFSTEDKITASIPPSTAVMISKAALLEQAGGPQKKEIENEYAARMKLRALNCGKGASISLFASKEEVKKQVGNATCFAAADKDIEKWLGLCRVGIVAAKPPLRTIPATAPAFILGGAFIQSARFAENAGVALLETQKSIQIVDIETSNVIYEEQPKSSSNLGQLSQNGPLFTARSESRTMIRDAESGATLLEPV